MPQVEIIVGSPSDEHFLWDSKMPETLEEVGVTYAAHALSAHRNPAQLQKHVEDTSGDACVYVCAAGMAAALPGAVKAILLPIRPVPVIGIALPSTDFPNAEDAIHGITRLPPGLPKIYGGVGVAGFNEMALVVCELVSLVDYQVSTRLLEYMKENTKKPKFNLQRPDKEAPNAG